MTPTPPEMIHATTIAIGDRAVLIEGHSGAGKSDLALRLIDRGGTLVSDDYTTLNRRDGVLLASAPATIAGRLEVRGLGILEMPYVEDVPVALIVTIVEAPARMPATDRARRIAGVDLPELALAALEPSAPIKVELALKRQATASA